MGQQFTTDDVPRLCDKLREAIQSKLRRPVDPDLDFLTTQIELASAHQAEPQIRNDEWAQYGLTPSEAAFASILKARFGKVVSKCSIMAQMYGDKDGPTSDITGVLACRMNKKLDASPYCIANEPGVGYKMIEGKFTPKSSAAVREVWRDEIFMGPKQARAAEILFQSLGKWVRTADLVQRVGARHSHIYAVIDGLRGNLEGTPYSIETQRRHGFRMICKTKAIVYMRNAKAVESPEMPVPKALRDKVARALNEWEGSGQFSTDFGEHLVKMVLGYALKHHTLERKQQLSQ